MDESIQDLLIRSITYGYPDPAMIDWLKDTHNITFNPDNYHWRPVNKPREDKFAKLIKETYEASLISQLEAQSTFLSHYFEGENNG